MKMKIKIKIKIKLRMITFHGMTHLKKKQNQGAAKTITKTKKSEAQITERTLLNRKKKLNLLTIFPGMMRLKKQKPKTLRISKIAQNLPT